MYLLFKYIKTPCLLLERLINQFSIMDSPFTHSLNCNFSIDVVLQNLKRAPKPKRSGDHTVKING